MKKSIQFFLLFILGFYFITACTNTGDEKMTIEKELFGILSDSSQAFLFTLKHPDGSIAKITNYGAALVTLKVPDKNGFVEDVVLGFDSLSEYEKIRGFYGAIVGRYGNRLAKGKFVLNGKEYTLATNDGENHLHGGIKGFDRVLWQIDSYGAKDSAFVELSYLSPDGEEGYPGNLQVKVVYSFTMDKSLRIDYTISSDKETVSNITSHGYFNLSGNLKKDILSHDLMLNADHFLPVKKGLIPTGEIHPVAGTVMDFREPFPIGGRINEDDIQLAHGLGYDHNWILNAAETNLKMAATLFEKESGRLMEVFTTEPGIQFYSGNFMDGSHKGHAGRVYNYRHAICLETQHYPDSPNHDHFPTTVISPGDTYKSTTIYKFSVK